MQLTSAKMSHLIFTTVSFLHAILLKPAELNFEYKFSNGAEVNYGNFKYSLFISLNRIIMAMGKDLIYF